MKHGLSLENLLPEKRDPGLNRHTLIKKTGDIPRVHVNTPTARNVWNSTGVWELSCVRI